MSVLTSLLALFSTLVVHVLSYGHPSAFHCYVNFYKLLQIKFEKGVVLDNYLRYKICYSLIRRNEERSCQRHYRHSNLCEFLNNGEKFMMQRKLKRAFQVEEVPKRRHGSK